MKKKIINGIMMVALVVATSTSFVSCKDTNEDVRIEQDAKINALQNELDVLEGKYGDLDGRVSALRTDVDALAASMTQAEAQLAEFDGKIANLENAVDNLQIWLVETFGKLVTSVEISGTYNNMLGSINVPGFEPKMLINNWGVAADDVEFPKYDGYEGNKVIAGKGEELGTNPDNYGFAGFIYANVNRYIDDMPLLTKAQDPQNGIFEFTIANTAGEDVEGLLVGNVDADGQPTTDVLRWGWTRADNNIFKFAVAYGGENAKAFAPAKIDLSKFKADLKQVWADRNRQTGTSKQALGHLVADLYYNLATKDTNMKKYALKVTWKDNTIYAYDKDGQTIIESNEEKGLQHIATSEAELVFMTIKPLSFNSGQALVEAGGQVVGKVNYTIEKLEPYINKIVKRVKDKLNLTQYRIDTTPFNNIKQVGSDYFVSIDAGKTINLTSIPVVPGGPTVTTTYTVAAPGVDIKITDIVKPIEQACNNMNTMLTNFDDLFKKNYGQTVTNYLEKFTNKIGTLFANNADQMLQPVLLAIDKDGNVGRVSGIEEMPYIADGEITLEPTTYTAELFAPCYAKFLGCKDIEEAGFNEIIYSNDKEIKFTPESGKTYEIVYQALDFFGNVVEHSYYIQGK